MKFFGKLNLIRLEIVTGRAPVRFGYGLGVEGLAVPVFGSCSSSVRRAFLCFRFYRGALGPIFTRCATTLNPKAGVGLQG